MRELKDIIEHIDRKTNEHKQKASKYFQANYPQSFKMEDQFSKELFRIRCMIMEVMTNGTYRSVRPPGEES